MSVTLNGSGQTILQVVNATTSTNISTTSASFVTTNLSATITPFATTSKILILVRYNGYDTSSAGSEHTVFRGGTNLGSATYGFQVVYSTTTQQLSIPIVMNYLDSPATTSATTYTCYMASNGGQTISAMGYSTPGTITLLEISGA